MPLIYQHRIYRVDLRNNPDVLYLFGDNEARRGRGGQASECRDEPNAVGVATKRLPSRTQNAYWADADFDRCAAIVDQDLGRAFSHVRRGGIVVCPSDGLGTDRAELPDRAPRIFDHIRARIKELKTAARNQDGPGDNPRVE